jgi:hypothetical protein
VARSIYDGGLGYVGYVLTMAGFAVLFMAATPLQTQLAALHSGDGFPPRQLTHRAAAWSAGGIHTLSGSAYRGRDRRHGNELIPLYAIGVFSVYDQPVCMVRRFGAPRWGLTNTPGAETKIAHDPTEVSDRPAFGAVTTFVVMLVFIITKFTSGAWFIVILIPALVCRF